MHVKPNIVTLLSGDTCKGCPAGPPQTSLGQDGRNTPLLYPPLLSPGFRCNTLTDSFPSLIFTFPTYLRWVTGSVMAWTAIGGSSRLYITPNYTAPYLTTQLPSLTIVRSCFHISSVLLSCSKCSSNTIPYIPRSCNNVLSVEQQPLPPHILPLYQLPCRPQTRNFGAILF